MSMMELEEKVSSPYRKGYQTSGPGVGPWSGWSVPAGHQGKFVRHMQSMAPWVPATSGCWTT